MSVDVHSVKFLFSGSNTRDSDTPIGLHMKNEDVIFALLNARPDITDSGLRLKRNDVNNDYIRIKAVDQNANEKYYRIKTSTPFGKLKQSIAEFRGIDVSSIRLHYSERVLRNTDTPGLLEMENDGIIDVTQDQISG